MQLLFNAHGTAHIFFGPSSRFSKVKYNSAGAAKQWQRHETVMLLFACGGAAYAWTTGRLGNELMTLMVCTALPIYDNMLLTCNTDVLLSRNRKLPATTASII